MKKNFLFLSLAVLSLTACSSDDNNDGGPSITPPSSGATLSPQVGGPAQPNQVYIDFSSNNTTAVSRTAWDLGFYSGSDFRVVINGSIKMAVKQTESTDITQPVEIDPEVSVAAHAAGGSLTGGNIQYIDNPNGDINGTAFAAVSATDSENKVYLVNLGNAIGEGAVSGEHRGWKKVRVLRSGNDYKIQYADVNATAFEEKVISKNPEYNFTFFSLTTNNVVSAEPKKAEWDVNFTTFTNTLQYGPTLVSYFYSDFIVSNTKAGTRAYQVTTEDGQGLAGYELFTLADVDDSLFSTDEAKDQRAIGPNWRNPGGPSTNPSVKDNVFYVVKDVSGNIYKVVFRGMVNEEGERGNPTIEYSLVQ